MDDRKYAVIRMVPGFNRALFNRAKANGLRQTSFDSLRKSIDGTEAIVSFRGNAPPQIQAFIKWQGDHTSVLAYLADAENIAAWELQHSAPARTIPSTIRAAWLGDENFITPLPGKAERKTNWLPWALAASTAAAGAAYYFLNT